MTHRAILHGVDGLEKPKQEFSNSPSNLKTWANETLARLTAEQRTVATVVIEKSVYLTLETVTLKDATPEEIDSIRAEAAKKAIP